MATPTIDSEVPDRKMRGPVTISSLIASRSAWIEYPSEPTSRTVVNPASSVFFALAKAKIATSSAVSIAADQ